MEKEEERLAFFRKRQDHYQREFIDHQREGMNPAEIGVYDSYMKFIKEKIDLQIEAVETASKQVEEKKEELLAARRERKTLERLRSRQYDAFLIESRRRETRYLDEVAVGRHERRIRERRG
jgi:flagellar FliJ protein